MRQRRGPNDFQRRNQIESIILEIIIGIIDKLRLLSKNSTPNLFLNTFKQLLYKIEAQYAKDHGIKPHGRQEVKACERHSDEDTQCRCSKSFAVMLGNKDRS